MHAGFTLHGLWPARGDGDAENCKTSQRVPDATIQRMLPLMPNRRLIIHEWRKHGACTGLAPDAYFSLAERAFESVRIPVEFNSPKTPQQRDGIAIKQDFAAANVNLSADDIELSCTRGELVDVRVCLTSALAPHACADPRQHACEEPLIVRPPR
jgi:ribonuclease T2